MPRFSTDVEPHAINRVAPSPIHLCERRWGPSRDTATGTGGTQRRHRWTCISRAADVDSRERAKDVKCRSIQPQRWSRSDWAFMHGWRSGFFPRRWGILPSQGL